MTGLLCSCLGFLGNVIFWLIVCIKLPIENKITSLHYKNIDINAKDFSVKLNISDKQFEEFKR